MRSAKRRVNAECEVRSAKCSKTKTTKCCFGRSETAQSKELKEGAGDRRATTMRRWREMRNSKCKVLN